MSLQSHLKIKVYVALETETSGQVMYQCNRMLKYDCITHWYDNK
jgi:hypothetical protein